MVKKIDRIATALGEAHAFESVTPTRPLVSGKVGVIFTDAHPTLRHTQPGACDLIAALWRKSNNARDLRRALLRPFACHNRV